ncbi:FAD-binding oxidoreductase, partial [Pseudomonas sp. FW305-BF6]
MVKKANIENKKIRVVGSRHSFTPLISTTDFLVSLDHLQGVITIDKENQIAEVWAGTKLERLGQELYQSGFAQENLGDINVQSIAGALLT